jgi:hypothetical protein
MLFCHFLRSTVFGILSTIEFKTLAQTSPVVPKPWWKVIPENPLGFSNLHIVWELLWLLFCCPFWAQTSKYIDLVSVCPEGHLRLMKYEVQCYKRCGGPGMLLLPLQSPWPVKNLSCLNCHVWWPGLLGWEGFSGSVCFQQGVLSSWGCLPWVWVIEEVLAPVPCTCLPMPSR